MEYRRIHCTSKCVFEKNMKETGWSDENLPDESYAVISICGTSFTEGGDSVHYFKKNHDNVLNVEFDDIDADSDAFANCKREGDYIVYGTGRLLPISEQVASEIVKFIDAHIGCNFILHCNAGVSRSQAVVRYIIDMYSDDYNIDDCIPTNKPECPNCYVLMKLKRTYRNLFDNYYQ